MTKDIIFLFAERSPIMAIRFAGLLFPGGPLFIVFTIPHFTSRLTDKSDSARHIIFSFRFHRCPNYICTAPSDKIFIAEYSCNLSRNNRSLLGAKFGIDAVNPVWMYPPAIGKAKKLTYTMFFFGCQPKWPSSAWQ